MFEDYRGSLTAWDQPSWQALLHAVEENPQWDVFAFDYEFGYLLEPASAPIGWQPSSLRPLVRCWRFGHCRSLRGAAIEEFLASELGGLPDAQCVAGVGGLQPGMRAAEYEEKVEAIRRYIAAGDCYQVNFTFPLKFQWFGHPLALYCLLRQRQPVGYGGLLWDGDAGLLSLSPELFFEKRGDRLRVRPMKGTAPRAVDSSVLANSLKDRAENLMIVDLLRNDLGRVAVSGSVHVDALFDIEAYPTVWQMTSQVSAEAPGKSLEELLSALYPCGSITGAPKIRAMQIAAELEKGERGIYTGSLGWRTPGGDMRLNVAIRTLELLADHRGRLGLGSGIVADSEPAAEWAECFAKAAFLTGAEKPWRLIETLRREEGAYCRLEGHLRRLAASAAWAGFVFDRNAVEEALAALPPGGKQRVRLTLGEQGDVEISAFPLVEEPVGPRFARWAGERVDSRNPLQFHKTTLRQVYDRALRDIANEPAVFDVLYLNERGEVAEGARSNVFVEKNGRLVTPPLSCGVLPGVLRDELLRSGRAVEGVLTPADLKTGFWLGNSLRGLVPVTLKGKGDG